ncbi:WD40-repeat-containing domain protein [Tricladium varicosporioides]|nr:WD40-repeat-containing domain protein [Hymenoscyphus varicosporioides]
MSSFFTIPSAQKKRKRTEGNDAPKKRFASTKTTSRDPKPARRKPQRDESISGSDDESDDGPREDQDEDEASSSSESGGEDEEETAAERRLRLAERYLENIREEVDEVGFDAEEIDRDLIAERLKEDVAESKGRMYRKLANELSFQSATHSRFQCNSQTFTSIATCPPYVYTVSKDICLIKWRIQDLPEHQWPQNTKKGRKANQLPPPPKRKPVQVSFTRGNKSKSKSPSYQGHTSPILTVAASQDGKFVVTGGTDRKIIVWEASTLEPLRVFTQHRDAVTGLAFRRGTNQLYSSSKDRTIKVWSLDELAYVETLFGHQDEVVDIAALTQERCLSVGARDRTARLWKVVEETQLVFRGGGGSKSSSKSRQEKILEGSMDRITLIDDETFITGSDNGSLCLWTIHKKKPIFTIPFAHGFEDALKPDEASAEVNPGQDIVPKPQPRWITALASLPYSDVIISGSWDGYVRVWRVSGDKKKLESCGVLGSPSATSASLSLAIGTSHITDVEEERDGNLSAKGMINDISIFERGDRGKDGLCVVVAVGKEHRLGRWKKVAGGRNGGVVFEIPRVSKEKTNGEVE